jgi:hypothetical protein
MLGINGLCLVGMNNFNLNRCTIMQETKLPAGVVAYLASSNRLFDPVATGLSILNFKIHGAVVFLGITEVDLPSRNGEPAVTIDMEVGDKKLSLIDSMFLQALVVTPDHFEKMQDKMKHKHSFSVKGGSNEEFESLFFFEELEENGLRDADALQPIHKALGLGDDTSTDTDLGKLNLELVGIMVNKRRDDDVIMMDHDFPRSRAGAYPEYRTLREKFEEENGSDEIYTIGKYTEDYNAKHGKNPNIQNIVNVARNWTFTPIFKDKGGIIK